MRRKFDLYETNRAAVVELSNTIRVYGKVLEPCAGNHHISKLLKLCYPLRVKSVVTNDPLVNRANQDYNLDARGSELYEEVRPDWIVTNPPFSIAYDILTKGLEYAHCAFLLRLSFLEGTYERQGFLMARPPTDLIVLPRYSYTENGKTDSVTCAWMVWYKDSSRPQSIRIAGKAE